MGLQCNPVTLLPFLWIKTASPILLLERVSTLCTPKKGSKPILNILYAGHKHVQLKSQNMQAAVCNQQRKFFHRKNTFSLLQGSNLILLFLPFSSLQTDLTLSMRSYNRFLSFKTRTEESSHGYRERYGHECMTHHYFHCYKRSQNR